MRSVTVVGASLAGLSSVRALRERGFDGRVVVVGDEPHRPYDRPPLSKGFLTGAAHADDLALLAEQDDALDVEWRLGVPRRRARPGHPHHHPRRRRAGRRRRRRARDRFARTAPARHRRAWPASTSCARSTTRVALRAALVAGGPLVVVGAGFIGGEVASSARSTGVDVTVVEAQDTPLCAQLGDAMGAVVARLHAGHGVRLRTGVGVARLRRRPTASRPWSWPTARCCRPTTVVVGIGAQPNVEWLADSGLDVAGGVRTDASVRHRGAGCRGGRGLRAVVRRAPRPARARGALDPRAAAAGDRSGDAARQPGALHRRPLLLVRAVRPAGAARRLARRGRRR